MMWVVFIKEIARFQFRPKFAFSIGIVFIFLSTTFCARELLILSPDDTKYAWMDALIEEEFAAYQSSGITREMLDATQNSDAQGWNWARVRVVDSKIYGVGPASRFSGSAVWAMLKFLLDHYDVPDVEFVYLVGDGLLQTGLEPTAGGCGPSFVSAKNKYAKNQILFCDWYFFIDGVNHSQSWYFISECIEAEVHKVAWDHKIQKAFWRGGGNGFSLENEEKNSMHYLMIPRVKAAYLSALYPALVDAGLSGSSPFLEYKKKVEGLDLVKRPASLEEHLRYKYQLCLDGHTCSYTGYPWRLLSGCCSFKQETPNIQWFYPIFKPWVHYIPVKEDLSDCIEKIRWAIAHDDEAKKIAETAREFGKDHIMPEHVALYCYKTLVKYASLQKFKPEAPSKRRRRKR